MLRYLESLKVRNSRPRRPIQRLQLFEPFRSGYACLFGAKQLAHRSSKGCQFAFSQDDQARITKRDLFQLSTGPLRFPMTHTVLDSSPWEIVAQIHQLLCLVGVAWFTTAYLTTR